MTFDAFDSIVTGDGCRIAYRFDGDPALPVLMLSNSLGTSMAMWESQLEAFMRTHHVLRYDSRGHGGSDAPAGAYSIDRLGCDAVELMDALDLATVDFCGLSKGGMVGQWLGYRHPDRLRHLILANTSAYMGPAAGWQGRIATVVSQGMAAICDAVLDRWFTPEFLARNGDGIDSVRGQFLATSAQGYAGCCAAIRDMDLRPTARLIDVPTLVIGGSRDPATPPDHADHLGREIPQAILFLIEAAHLSNVECPRSFTDLVQAFLAGQPVGDAVS
jgi:3-oxoadipate enol-lactonase